MDSLPGKPARRIDLFGVLALLIPFAVYMATLAPSVTFFDSGEFITAISSLGTAHSPGYPTYVNFAKPFTWLPFGNIAFRVNIATAFSAALACYGVYLLLDHLLATEPLVNDPVFSRRFRKLVALSSALAFAFTSRLWLQSNHDKPYPLISFISAFVFYLLLRWRDRYDEGVECPHYVYLGAFLCGLATGAHQTIVLMVPAYAWLILAKDWRLISRIKEFVIACTFALLGFSIHLHNPVRATTNPLLNWGDPRSVTQFLWNFLRQGYPTEPPARDGILLWKQIGAFNISHEFTWVGVVLVVIGGLAFLRKRRDEILAYIIGITASLLVIAGYFNTPEEIIFLTEEFFTPLYLLTAVMLGFGLFYLLKICIEGISRTALTGIPVRIAATLFLFILPAGLCAMNYYENDQHENYIAYDYANNTFRSLPLNTVYFTWGDSGAFPLWYLQGVERMRQDLRLVHTPHLVFPWYLDIFPDLYRNSRLRSIPDDALYPDMVLKLAIAEQVGRRPVFIDFSTRYSISFDQYRLSQRGICYQIVPGSGPLAPDLQVWSLYTTRGFFSQSSFRDLDTGKAILIYATSLLEAGEYLMRAGRFSEGRLELQRAERISPELHGQVTRVLGGYGSQ